MASNLPGIGTWVKRFASYAAAILSHATVLLLGLITAGLFAIPAWIKPLLSPACAEKLDFWTAWLATPEVYAELAKASVVVAAILAGFLAWNEERDELETIARRLNELEGDKPNLIATSSGFWAGVAETQRFGKTPIVLVNLEIVNSGGPTSIRQWGGVCRFKDGHRAFLSDRMFVEEHLSFGDQRNLVSDDWLLKKGERRLGGVAFYLSDNPHDIYQVSVQFHDYTGQMYSVSVPDDESTAQMESLGLLPWQQAAKRDQPKK